jgi:branched-chain amino acid transport system ATP-binding protein
MSLLHIENLSAYYGPFQALFDISMEVGEGEVVAIIGANGAGKSTFLQSVAGLIASTSAAIRWDGEPVGQLPAHEMVKRGVILVPEGRGIFPSLSVEENLLIGAYRGRAGAWNLREVYRLFPILEERAGDPGTALSGGMQQMLAIGRGLMANPRLLLLDEISLGLAPLVVKELYRALSDIVARDTMILIVEQDVAQAMAVSHTLYCFQEGRISLQGRPTELTKEQIVSAYFGL